uniref:Uncharacterized protein n=1 Tax=Clytia hemisphaerica TaxID=252671 RepID=A0A7M5URW6_9CNID
MTGSTINKRLNPKMESIQPVTHCPKLDLKTKALEDQNMKKRGRKRKRITCSSSRRAKKSKIEPLIITTEKCCFCLMGPDKEKGTFFQDQNSNIAAHQFCLLFSAGLPQAGEDNEGFEGFLVADILKEVQRVSKLICKFCGRNGANLGCCVQHCRSIYHFNCGYKEGLQFQFCGSFDTYCHVHRSHQDLSLVRTKPKHQFCPICLENFSSVPLVSSETVLKTPCCNNVFVHKECVQRQASVAGYFFRCPCCNNKDEFGDEMAKYGIYIPSRDAAWEESNAYNDLLQEYDKCDFNNCSCTRGRKYSTQAGKWHLLRCYLCGQSAVHVKCLGRCYIPGIGYVCATCNKVAKLNKENIETVQQQSYTERLKEHKRRLNLLKSRNDPVLLASEVFSKEILRKKFNIVNDCKVRLRRLDINIKSRKMKLSTALKFLQTPNENKTHLVTTKSVLAPVRKSPRKSPLKSLIQVQPKKLGVNTNYMFRDRGSRGENMWLESQSDLSEINSTTLKTNNENRTHKVISNEDDDCHSVIDPNNNQFVNKNLEKEELDNESPKGSTADTQDRENIVESLKQTGMNTKRKPAKLSCQERLMSAIGEL